MTPVLADLEKKGLLPEAMLADTAYGSDENVQAAADLGVELVTPTPGNGSTATEAPTSDAAPPPPECAAPTAPPMAKLTIEDFAMDERTGKVEACPSGRVPLNILYDQGTNQDKIVIEMKPEDCASCPFREACPVEKTKKGKYKVEYTPKQRRQEERRREEDTAAFRERYAKRSGLESTNGGLKRKHGLGELRVRGRPAVRHALFLKVAGWNLNRATASGKLTSKVAEMLRKLGFGGWWEACFSLCCALLSVCRIRRLAIPPSANENPASAKINGTRTWYF